MGLNASVQKTETFNGVMKKETSDILSKTTNKTSANVGTTQSNTTTMNGSKIGGDLTQTNIMKINVSAIQKMTSEQLSTMMDEIIQKYNTELTSRVKQENKNLPVLTANISAQIDTVVNDTRSELHTAIDTTIKNTINASVTSGQQNNLEMSASEVGGSVVHKNELSLELLVENITSTITGVLQKSFTDADITTKVIKDAFQSNDGVMGWLTIFLIVIGVCMGLATVGGVAAIYMKQKNRRRKLSPKKKKSYVADIENYTG
jgi:hypothetical protein